MEPILTLKGKVTKERTILRQKKEYLEDCVKRFIHAPINTYQEDLKSAMELYKSQWTQTQRAIDKHSEEMKSRGKK